MATIPLELVPLFLTVAEHGSFSIAATRLGIEKSSVSRAIARLEQAIGIRLFLRTTRMVLLTDEGQLVRDRLREPYAGLDAALREVAEAASAPKGRIVLSAPADFGAAILTEVLARFVAQYPQVEVEVRLASELSDLAAAGLDAAIRISAKKLSDSALKARKVGILQLGIYAAPSYLNSRGNPRSVDEARTHAWILFPSTREIRLQGPDGMVSLKPSGRVSCDDMFFVHHMVLQGSGLGVLPSFLADDELRRGRLVQVLPRWSVTPGHIWFLTPCEQKPTRIVGTLRDLLIEVLASRGLGLTP